MFNIYYLPENYENFLDLELDSLNDYETLSGLSFGEACQVVLETVEEMLEEQNFDKINQSLRSLGGNIRPQPVNGNFFDLLKEAENIVYSTTEEQLSGTLWEGKEKTVFVLEESNVVDEEMSADLAKQAELLLED